MNISYKWLCDYLPRVATMSPEEVADALTSIGLETGSVEKVDSIKGGLEGLVVGRVETCEMHPNSDHLHCTTVDVGGEEPLKIVCGAPNVASGQHVIVATIGATLYSGEESFVIKKSKLRGEESFGMICSEVEIGVGVDSSGIMVLPETAVVGTPAAKYFGLESDYCLEVDITPNRIDATSHFGVARDLAAYLTRHGSPQEAKLPQTERVLSDLKDGKPIMVSVDVAPEECPRYQGVTMEGLTNGESPKWLRERLAAIGVRPISLLVDISNFVLHEVGQPLHFFDADKVAGGEIHIEKLPEGTPFTTLDGVERKLNGREIMICDARHNPLCMAGIFGGAESGVSDTTTRIFIESANFNSTSVRKAARAHALNTDSSFRFERGLDPAATSYALRRAVALLQELAGGKVVGEVIDCRQMPVEHPVCTLRRSRLTQTIGAEIPDEEVLRILQSLDITVQEEWPDGWLLNLPVYRIDVRREVDVIEEVLRIYGYNEVPLKGYIRANLSTRSKVDKDYHTELLLSEQLVGVGYQEILSNSLTAEKYYTGLETYPAEHLVHLLNPLSQELGVLRETLLFGGLEAIARNFNNKQQSCAFFEWGNCYRHKAMPQESLGDEASRDVLRGYSERAMFGLWLSGTYGGTNWLAPKEQPVDVYRLKADVENILCRLNIPLTSLQLEMGSNDIFSDFLAYQIPGKKKHTIVWMGEIKPELLRRFDISMPVYYAEFDREFLMEAGREKALLAQEIVKYPIVKRDFALLLGQEVTFAQVEAVARKAEQKLLKKVELFDVYTGKNLPEGKKSYAVSFYLQDATATLTDKQIEKTMQRVRTLLEKELGAELR